VPRREGLPELRDSGVEPGGRGNFRAWVHDCDGVRDEELIY
jgi:hypothetical protein